MNQILFDKLLSIPRNKPFWLVGQYVTDKDNVFLFEFQQEDGGYYHLYVTDVEGVDEGDSDNE
jgi:uncharacterized membrane protein